MEVDRLGKAREHANDALQPVDLAVGDGDAAAEAGRAQPLAISQPFDHQAWVDIDQPAGGGGELLE